MNEQLEALEQRLNALEAKTKQAGEKPAAEVEKSAKISQAVRDFAKIQNQSAKK